MNPYGPVAIFLAVAAILSFVMIVVPGLAARKKPNPVKAEAYECGAETTTGVSGRFPVRFYLIAMLFVIFDVEAVFIFPWATRLEVYAGFGLMEMGIFVFILLLGLVYAWRKGVLRWL